jgi:hypothetical protein
VRAVDLCTRCERPPLSSANLFAITSACFAPNVYDVELRYFTALDLIEADLNFPTQLLPPKLQHVVGSA